MGSSEKVCTHGHGFEGAGLRDSLQGVEACVATYQEVQLDRDEYMNLVAMESEAGMALAGKCHSKAEGKTRAWSVNHLNNETIGQHTCKPCRRE